MTAMDTLQIQGRNKMKYLVDIENSIKDILQTPLGSRVMLPEYGSRLYELIDKKIDDEFRANLSWYVIEAVEKWEKRIKIDEVKLVSLDSHKLKIKLVLTSTEELSLNLEIA
ncbi:baseplate assembly protein W [Campylobacter hyointestinalis subsp. hyointestinalis]|uniref:Baseplate assembly protein W n=2 Tax=Campylobacter hyointestinalis TaxID=198 RepID=A0A9W5ANT3_CAMHY|nr:baseplate assembly protein W [Campylobacter hyointestinalis subsp. hyointestinalis]